MKNYPTHTLYAVSRADQAAKATWTPIGVAFTNKGGTLSIRFDEGKGQPANTDLVLAPYRQRSRTENGGNQGGAE